MSRKARIARAEEFVSTALKARAERMRQQANQAPFYAQCHATAVAAIALAGEPRIDEPLVRAWARTLHHYEIAVREPTEKSEQVRAAQQLFPIIVGERESSSKFAEIFSTAPSWLLQFTRIVFDAWVLRFRLPDIEPSSNWGTEGFADAGQWPFLPLGVLTAGNPIPNFDRRQLMLGFTSVAPPIDRLPKKDIYLAAQELDAKRENTTILDEIFSWGEKTEWSAYDRRRMRKIIRLISRGRLFT